MANARIYKPARNIMQSGKGKMDTWVLEFEPSDRKSLDPLMGWSGSGDTLAQVRLRFPSQEAAQGYAASQGLEAEVIEARAAKVHKRNYADKFAFDRIR